MMDYNFSTLHKRNNQIMIYPYFYFLPLYFDVVKIKYFLMNPKLKKPQTFYLPTKQFNLKKQNQISKTINKRKELFYD